jgi:hypothetical protein
MRSGTLRSLALSGRQVEHGDVHWAGRRQEDGHPGPRLVCQVCASTSQLVASVVDVHRLELLLEWQLACRRVDLQLLALAQYGAVEIVGC